MATSTVAMTPRVRPQYVAWALWALCIAAVALTAWGIYSHGLLKQDLWSPDGWRRFKLLALGYVGWSTILVFLARRWFVPATVAAAGLIGVFGLGLPAVLAVLWFLFSALTTGTLVLPRDESSTAPKALRLLAGLTIWMLVIWTAVHFRVNYAAVYAIAFGLPMAFRPSVTLECLKEAVGLVHPAVPDKRTAAMSAGAAFPLLCHFALSFEPELAPDALGVHAAIGGWVSAYHYWPFDYRHFAWALQPLGADWCFTAVFVLAGEYAARLLNFAFLGILAGVVYGLTRRHTKVPAALLAVTLFASMPIVQFASGSLMTENLWAGLIAGALWSLLLFRDTGRNRWMYLVAMLLGGSAATKPGSIAWILPLAALAGFALFKSGFGFRKTCRVILSTSGLFILFATPPYVYAYATSGNPVFPYFNDVFKSPWFANVALSTRDHISNERFRDLRWNTALGVSTPYDLMVASRNFLESRDGALGLHVLILLALAVAGLAEGLTFSSVATIVALLAGSVLTLRSIAYIRYIYPALPMLAAAGAAGLVCLGRRAGRAQIALWALLLLGVAGNMYLLPSSGWIHSELLLNPFNQTKAEEFRRRVPARVLSQYLNIRHPGVPAAFLGNCDIAGFNGRSYCLGWYNVRYELEVQQVTDAAGYLALAKREGIDFFIVPHGWTTDRVFITDFLAKYTAVEREYAGFELRRLKAEEALRQKLGLPEVSTDLP